MNTWSSFRHGDVAGIVLHSVPPLLVFCAAETAPVLRDRLTEAVLRAEQTAALADPARASHRLDTTPAAAKLPTPTESPQTPSEATGVPTKSKPSQAGRKPAKPGRKLLADYVAEAVAAIDPIGGLDLREVTPAWARHTTGCSAGLSAKVAAAVRDDLSTNSIPQTSTDDTDATGEPARVAA
jgi:hypothetical protein